MKDKNTWDDMENYFNPETYAEADIEAIKRFFRGDLARRALQTLTLDEIELYGKSEE
jgi:hypothetical protein